MVKDVYITDLSEGTLKNLYQDLGQTCKDIGDAVGLTEDAILWNLRKFGIPRKSRGVKDINVKLVYMCVRKDLKKGLTKEALLDRCLRGMTDDEIGKEFGMSGEGVSYRRQKFGIDKNIKPLKCDKSLLLTSSKEDLERDYLSLSAGGFSEKYGVSKVVWRPHLKSLGVVDKTTQRINKYPPFTKKQRSLIIGGLLGDGSVSGKTHYYESHSIKQKMYLEKKRSILNPYSLATTTCDGGSGVQFKTIHHPNFLEFYKEFYREGVSGKHIPVQFIKDNWDDEVLAYWFLDDGNYDDENNTVTIFNKCPDQGQLDGFLSFLSDRYGWDFKMYTKNIVSFSKKYIEDFVRIVLSVATPDMYYKIPEKYLTSDLISQIPVDPDGSVDIRLIKPKFYRATDDPLKKYQIESILLGHLKGISFPYQNLTEDRKKYLVDIFVGNSQDNILKGDCIEANTLGMNLCEGFFPNIYEANRKGSISPIDAWGSGGFLERFAKNRLMHADRLTPASFRTGIKLMARSVSNFKPSVAKFLYKAYPCNGKVLDYSAGYGARMLAAMSLGLEYVGIEPNTKTHENLVKFGTYLKDKTDGSFEVIKGCAEDVVYRDNYFGFAFSSPPYFDFEKYSDEDTQSIVRYPEYDAWLSKFWYRTVDNCLRSLVPGGYFGVCLSPYICSDMIEKTVKHCNGAGAILQDVFKVRFAKVFHSEDRFEKIFIFRTPE